eukprot:m.33570 g.33570  ORF g.33570 m.33570 type:complete len:287 (-) comp16840_c0_seq1:288-1148(-)
MSTDLDIDRDIFNGRIAIAFMLASSEIPDGRSSDNYEPFFLLAPRTGYLTLCSDKIRRHFHLPLVTSIDNEIWFEYNGRPLKWNNPIGVLYDCFGADKGLPWEVTVHVKNYPESQIMRCASMGVIETHFINQIKQACYIKHGTTQLDGLSGSLDKKELWHGLANDDFEHFRRGNEKLMVCKDGHWFKKAPFRLYLIDSKTLEDSHKPVKILQEPHPLTTVEGVPETLGGLIETLLGNVKPHKVVTHGLEAPLVTPLQWLCEHCAYPDNFLHITVFLTNTTNTTAPK